MAKKIIGYIKLQLPADLHGPRCVRCADLTSPKSSTSVPRMTWVLSCLTVHAITTQGSARRRSYQEGLRNRRPLRVLRTRNQLCDDHQGADHVESASTATQSAGASTMTSIIAGTARSMVLPLPTEEGLRYEIRKKYTDSVKLIDTSTTQARQSISRTSKVLSLNTIELHSAWR